MTNSKSKISILVAHDHPIARAGVRTLLSKAPDMLIVGEAENGNEVKKLVEKLQPQILLLDLIMPDLSPTQLERWIRENYPETVTLVLTAHDQDAYLAGMMEAGAKGYMHKDVRAEQLIGAIRRAASGESLFDEAQISRVRRWQSDVEQKWNSLTDREMQILQLLIKGMTNKQIADELTASNRYLQQDRCSHEGKGDIVGQFTIRGFPGLTSQNETLKIKGRVKTF